MPKFIILLSTLGFLPTAIKTLSLSALSLFLFELFVKSTTTLFFTEFADVTLESNLKLIPCFLRIFKNSIEISLSIPGII